MQILINNNFVEKDEAKISIFSDAIMYGYGVFETLRTYSGKRILKLDAHINRLINSANQIKLKLNYKFEEIQSMVQEVVEKSGNELQRIKLLALHDYLIITSNELTIDNNIYNGVSLKTCSQKRSMPEIKSTSYLDCLLNYNNAVQQGFYDALFIDDQNYVYECSRSNIFWIKNGKLFTRLYEVLPGITRDTVIEIFHLPFENKNGELSDLLGSDEVFITNSVIGVVPAVKIDDSYISLGQPGIETSKLMSEFENLYQK
jgi:branched-chain amino acid aminotransferase